MGADNWAVCPKCFSRAERDALAQAIEVESLYGKIPIEDFDKRRAAIPNPQYADFRTFRESFSVYNDDEGTVEISYRGTCTACPLSASRGDTFDLLAEGAK